MNHFLRALQLILCWGLIFPSAGLTLDNSAGWFDWEYRLEAPGARGRGMGGASAAVIDDAGAALVNPAALTALEQTELVIEVRAVRFDDRSIGGRVDGAGNPLQLSVRAEPSDQLNVSHLSLATPLGEGRTVLAVFFHRLALLDRAITLGDPRDGSVIQKHEPMFAVDEIGAALAREFWSGTLALGLSGSLATLNLDSKAATGDSALVAGAAGREFLFLGHQSEQEPIWRLGLVWKPTPSWRVTLTQALMPTIDYKLSTVDSTWVTADPTSSRCTPAAFSTGWVCESTMPIPDYFSAGAAYRVSDRLTLAGEVKSIQYSQRTHKFNGIFSTPGVAPVVEVSPGDFTAEDALELHLGGEWLGRVMGQPLQLRAGYYFDPAHGIRYRGADPTLAVLFDGGGDVHHGTLGLGVPFGRRHRLDIAIDLASDGRHQGLLGLLWRL